LRLNSAFDLDLRSPCAHSIRSGSCPNATRPRYGRPCTDLFPRLSYGRPSGEPGQTCWWLSLLQAAAIRFPPLGPVYVTVGRILHAMGQQCRFIQSTALAFPGPGALWRKANRTGTLGRVTEDQEIRVSWTAIWRAV